jgi:predicted SAM-dependent methyltransferase
VTSPNTSIGVLTQFRLNRPFTDYHKVQIAIGSVIRNHQLFQRKAEPGAYVDIGCGPNLHAGYYHIDYAWRPGLDLCWDIIKGLPLATGSVGGIFTEHCVEHIPFSAFVQLAAEFYRVLMAGRRVRIVVPDGALYFRRYLQGGPMPYETEDKLACRIYTPIMSVNRILYDHGHRFIYDFQTMRAVLAAAGFEDIEHRRIGEGKDRRLLIDSVAREQESLYVEAQKLIKTKLYWTGIGSR